MQSILPQLAEHGASLVAISGDEPSRAQSVQNDLALAYPVLADPSLEATRRLGVEDAENGIAWPAVFVLGRDGTIRWRDLTDDYRKRPTPQIILDAVAGLADGRVAH